MEVKNKIERIVVECLIILAEEEKIKSFEKPTSDTKIASQVDSMSLVALSVDIEEKYEEVFDKEIKVLNESEANFLLNFENVTSLVEYISKL